MSSAGNAIRAWIESLMDGSAGSGYTLETGRFHRVAEDCSILTHPADSCERAFDFEITALEPIIERNHYDGFDLVRMRADLSIAYLYTRAGGDNAEGITEQNGASTTQDIRDRAVTDTLDVIRVLNDPNNRGSTSPTILCIIAEEPTELTTEADRMVLTIHLRIDTQTVSTAAYAP